MPPTIHINLPDSWAGPSEVELTAAAQVALRTGRAEGAELSITLLPAESMRALNRDYHGADEPTDVLAFGLGSDPLIGDIYISPDFAEVSARELGIDPGGEILRLVIHGTLHLLGHDHPDGESRHASPMFELQERLLAGLLAEFCDHA